MTGCDLINNLLAHWLATNDSVVHNLRHVRLVLRDERAIARCESEEGRGGPAMHRWNLRLASLIAPSIPANLRTAGFQLYFTTFTASDTALLSQGKATLPIALNLISSNKTDSSLFLATLEVVKLVLARSTWYSEWAREVVGATVVQRTVNSLVGAANGSNDKIKLASVNAIVQLIPLFSTALRPLAPALHTLAITLICQDDVPAFVDGGASLFVSLYLLAPKGQEGLREAWRKGVEALVGSIDSLVDASTSNIFSESPLLNHTLPPLALPPCQDIHSTHQNLQRMEALTRVLCLALRTSTSERAGAVPIPVGALAELGARLVGLNSDTPRKERSDPTIVTQIISLLPRIQVLGCQILAQTSSSTGLHFSPHAAEALNTIASTLSTYPLRSPVRPALSSTYALVISSLGSSYNPEEGKRSLARVWRSILEDIGCVAVERETVKSSDEQTSRKTKRQKTSFDHSQSMGMSVARVRLEEVDLAIAERALTSLDILMKSPAAFSLTPKLRLNTARLLLAVCLDPNFFSTQSTSAVSTSYFPATSASRGIDIANQSVQFRRSVVNCLRMAAVKDLNAAEGLLHQVVEVWKKGCTDSDVQVKLTCSLALSETSKAIHPFLPPVQVNMTILRIRQEQSGGQIGDLISMEEGINDLAPKQVEQVGEEDSSSSEDEAEAEADNAPPVIKSGQNAALPLLSSESVQALETVSAATPTLTFPSTFTYPHGIDGYAPLPTGTKLPPKGSGSIQTFANEERRSVLGNDRLDVEISAAAVGLSKAKSKEVTIAQGGSDGIRNGGNEDDDDDDEEEELPTIVLSDDEDEHESKDEE